MQRRDFIKATAAGLAACAVAGCRGASASRVVRVLHSGDSISIQYGGAFKDYLGSSFDVSYVGFPGLGSAEITQTVVAGYQEFGAFDLVLVNGGLNDFLRYGLSLKEHWTLAASLASAAAHAGKQWAWASTTPAYTPGGAPWDEIDAANDLAFGFCQRFGGLYLPAGEFVKAMGRDAMSDDGIHLLYSTAEALGHFLAQEIIHLND